MFKPFRESMTATDAEIAAKNAKKTIVALLDEREWLALRSGAEPTTLHIREHHFAGCPGCDGPFGDRWETGEPVAKVVAKIQSGELKLDDLGVHRCSLCGYEVWSDVAIVPGSRKGTLSRSRQDRVFGTLRRLLREGADRETIAAEIRERYGVTSFYVPDR